MRRTMIFITSMMVVSSVWLATPVATQARRGDSYFTQVEKCLMRKINGKRRAHGRAALQKDAQLGYVARVHARKMARYGSVWHDSSAGSRVTRWYRLGQNTGRGITCRRMVRSFMRSYSHRANILGSWRFIGAGVRSRGRYIYVHLLFESQRDPGNVWQYP